MTQIVSSVFEKRLRAQIDEAVARELDILAAGSAVQDYPAYRECVGKIAALRSLHGFCDDVRDDLAKSK